MAINTIAPAIQAAAIFLTRPLITLSTATSTRSPSVLLALQLFLQNTLASNPNLIQLLSFDPASLPPLPIQLACITFRVKWADWIKALGGSAFELVIEPTSVFVVKKSTGQIGIVWVGKPMNDTSLPSSQLVASSNSSEEPQFESDEEESDASSNISRPSSRSSILSDSGLSAFSSHSSTSSKTSLSSFSHLEKTPLTNKPAPTPAPNANKTSAPTAPTRYLYQGGVSTVLTGGVMLGSASSSSNSSCSSSSSSSHIPTTTVGATTTVYTPPHNRARPRFAKSSRVPTGAGASAVKPTTSSWRRGGPCLYVKA